MVTKFFAESHAKDCCDQPTESHGAAEPKGSEPGVIQTHSLQRGLLFESEALNLNKAVKGQDSPHCALVSAQDCW